MPKLYYVSLNDLPITAINKLTLDPKFHYSDDSLHSGILNINGRVCHKLKFGILSSKDEAEELLNYWKPVLENRDYGNYQASIESIYSTKWHIKYAEDNKLKFNEIVDVQPIARTKKTIKRKEPSKSSDGLFIVEYLDSNNRTFYITSFKNNGGFESVNFLDGATLYSNRTFLEKKVSTIKNKLNKSLEILPLSPEQFDKIQHVKSLRY